jgi:glycosyltransferase involved in cell wall biosynthesis
MKSNPLVSVIIPTYNRADLIGRAVKSVFMQTYANLEIIVVDDASSDNTAKVVNSISDGRLKFIRHDVNKGPAASRNTGLRNSHGDYITFLDSDDEWLPQKIALQLDVFKENGEWVGLVFTNGFNEDKNTMAVTSPVPSGIYYDPHKDSFYPLRKLITPPSGWMLPCAVANKIGYFDESMYNWEDGDYLARIAYKYLLYFINENLVIWHASHKHANVISQNLIKGKEIFLENNFLELNKDKKYLFRFYRALGKDSIALDKTKARRYLLRALRMKPFDLSILSKLFRTF